MSETNSILLQFKSDVLCLLPPPDAKNSILKVYRKLAKDLSKKVGKSPAWSWRYVHSVYHDTIKPSKKFMLALERYYQVKPPLPEWLRRVKKSIASMAKATRESMQM
jgi:hypothetical protein